MNRTKTLALAAILALPLGACATTEAAPEPARTSLAATPTKAAAPKAAPKPVATKPAPAPTVEAAPAPAPVVEAPAAPAPVVLEAPAAPAPAPAPIAPPLVLEAPAAPAPAPAAPAPAPAPTFVPQEFHEPTPPGAPAYPILCDGTAGYVYDYTSEGCVYVGDANLGQGAGGNYVAPCNVDPELDTTGNNRPGYPLCSDVAAANGFGPAGG